MLKNLRIGARLMDLEKIKQDAVSATNKLLKEAQLSPKDAVVIGGSTSEIKGDAIGSNTNMQIAETVIQAIVPLLKEHDVYPVIQACEHINRALVVEREYALQEGLERVNVVPIATAGGGFATAAMEAFEDPVVVEKVQVAAGMDIGDAFIGMHLKNVGVVVRSDVKTIGKANLSMIRTRLKLIGGDRSKHF